MSQDSDQAVSQLRHVAHELKETFEERGYRVDSALEADPAFGSGTSRSALARDLAVGAASAAASQIGLDFRPVHGIGREFRCQVDGVDRRYRLLRAKRRSDGEYVLYVNGASSILTEEATLFPEERWVLGYTLSQDLYVEDVFVAPVLGVEGELPGRLLLGAVTQLLTHQPPPLVGGFQPTDEELDGFERDADEDEEGETGS